MIILSILIPTMPSRFIKFNSLWLNVMVQLKVLNEFHPTLGQVEVLYDDGQSYLEGGLSIGMKRGGLLKKAEGKYLCFLDDDEDIAPNYVETLVRLCQTNADVCCFRNLTKTDNYWTVIDMSLYHTENEEATPDRIVKRRPWHICPVKSIYANKYEFEDINYGEDFRWMEKVLTHCEIEAKTNQILHCYNHSSKHSEADKIMKHVQSK